RIRLRVGGPGRQGDARGFELAGGALRRQLELADRFDLVAEELDTNRIDGGGNEDVENAAAQRKVGGLLDLIGACEATLGKPLGDFSRRMDLTDGEYEGVGIERRGCGDGLHEGLNGGDDGQR